MPAAGNPSVEAQSPLSRVLVLDGWERMALAVARTMGRSGYPVGMAGTGRRHDVASSSRYVRRYDTLPDPTGPAAPYEAALHDLIEREGYAAIVPVHDQTLARLASIELPVPTLSPLDDAWRTLQDKVGLAAVCERAGVAYPRTEPISSPDDVDRAIERLGLPVFVKSNVSALALADRVAFARGASLARTRDEAAVAVTELSGELPVIAQALIDRGTKLNAVVLRRDGHSEVRYAHRVMREHPREGGTGISLESIDPDAGDGADAVTVLERLCEEVGYRGIVQAEMYRSASEGNLVVVDVNPRLWGSTWFVERQGLRVVERSLRAALDLPPLPPPVPRPGMRFHVPNSEMAWLRREPSVWAGLRDLAHTTRPGDIFEGIDATDPMPTLRWFASRVRAKTVARDAEPSGVATAES